MSIHHLILGSDLPAKEKKIEALKREVLTTPDALQFDYQLLHGKKLDPAEFKKALIDLPAVAKQRLILIREIDQLNAQNQKILLEILEQQPPYLVLIGETLKDVRKNAFGKKLSTSMRCWALGIEERTQNVFDLTRALTSRKPDQAIKILANMLNRGEHPLQLMGGLLWFWKKQKTKLSRGHYEKGLLVLQEADLNIKRSRLRSDYAIEVAIMKLYSLIIC